jgi:non-ribosomal peptide synthetase component F
MFGFKNAPMSDLRLPGLSLTSFPLQDGTAVFDLSFYLTDTAQGLTSLVRFNTDIFDPATISRMWQRYETLLSYAVEDPARKLSELRAHLEEQEQNRWLATEKELTQKRNQLLKNVRRKAVSQTA